ncbi:hypothetical protein ACEPAF_3006 [Sanghuangporus sanghuang]
MRCLRLLPLLPLLASSSPGLHRRVSGVTTDPNSVNGQIFDYIVVGGGTAGTTIAARLSEDPSKTVFLVEAGNDDRTNPDVFDVYKYSAAFGTSLDWAWSTDLDRTMHGGRTLGGSSSINGAHWTRAMKAQYDALSQLLGEEDSDMNWNFDSLFSYMKKAETFTPPDQDQRTKGANYNPDFHGFSGPVHAAYPRGMYGGPQQPAFANAVQNVTGIALCQDLNGGDANCVSFTPHTINPSDNDTRSSSATAYLSPVEDERTNWITLVNHQVTGVLFAGSAPSVRATGVEFKKSDNTGESFNASARQEVIVSAGAIGTPQLLQVSGIGDPAVLESLGINLKVNLSTVGRNLQEQAMNNLGHSARPSFSPDGIGPANCIAFPSLKELFSENGGSNGSVTADDIADYIMAMYPSWAESQAVNGLNSEALTTIFGIQVGLIVNDDAPVMELFFDTGFPDDIGIDMWHLLPFSRGNVTISDSSVFTKPEVNVNWFSVDFDLAVQIAGARLSRRVLNNTAFDTISSGETIPGTGTVPEDGHGGSDDSWQAWIQDVFSAVSHPIGTAAMMRRELGGVVDGKLRVYDTANLRVADASVLPIHLSAHLQSTIYGVAEKAADIIKSGI